MSEKTSFLFPSISPSQFLTLFNDNVKDSFFFAKTLRITANFHVSLMEVLSA